LGRAKEKGRGEYGKEREEKGKGGTDMDGQLEERESVYCVAGMSTSFGTRRVVWEEGEGNREGERGTMSQ